MKKHLTCIAMILISSSPIYANDNLVVKSAKKDGVTKCMKTIKQLSNILVPDDKPYGVSTLSDKRDPNRGFSATIEVRYPDTSSIVNMVVTPSSSGKCFASYTISALIDDPCTDLSQTVFKGSHFEYQLADRVSLFRNGVTNIYMEPINNKCLIVKSETLFSGMT